MLVVVCSPRIVSIVMLTFKISPFERKIQVYKCTFLSKVFLVHGGYSEAVMTSSLTLVRNMSSGMDSSR